MIFWCEHTSSESPNVLQWEMSAILPKCDFWGWMLMILRFCPCSEESHLATSSPWWNLDLPAIEKWVRRARDVKAIPCEPLQFIREWEGKLLAGYFPPQIGEIMHLLPNCLALSCKWSHNHIMPIQKNDLLVRAYVFWKPECPAMGNEWNSAKMRLLRVEVGDITTLSL